MRPGQHEVDAHPNSYKGSTGDAKKARDANVHVPWVGVAHVLEQYAGVQAAGGMPAYQERRARSDAVSYVYSGGKIQPGETWDRVKSSASCWT